MRLHLCVVILTWMETDGASLKMTPTAAGFTPTWPCLNLLWWWVSLAVTSDLCCCMNSENNLFSERLFCVGTEVTCVAFLWFHFALGKSGFRVGVAVWFFMFGPCSLYWPLCLCPKRWINQFHVGRTWCCIGQPWQRGQGRVIIMQLSGFSRPAITMYKWQTGHKALAS